ncbi:MAG: hypothetical protein GC161_18805 [Planctomycetaceae bacterium]|nr:hypothetical protein [Planctomycetaceae bacterium]
MQTSETAGEAVAAAQGPVLRGIQVAAGLVVGPALRKDGELERASGGRIPQDQVTAELNRFRTALERSRQQLLELRGHLEGKVSKDEARVLDTHLLYLKDSAFVNDVEKQILEHGLRLDAAVSKVVSDFERIFKLVESERLRQGAVDLRDVGIRVLRNLEADEGGPSAPREHYILVARELSIVDMFHLDGAHVAGIVVEEGGLAGHAAVFARSMGIPTLIGVKGLLDAVQDGDALLLDAGEGLVRVRPDEQLLAQYRASAPAAGDEAAFDGLAALTLDTLPTAGGAEVRLVATCGNLPEVAQAARAGVAEIALYRTELLFVAEPALPGLDSLRAHYEAVYAQARGARVTFRLLSVDSGIGAAHLAPWREPNPRQGRAGVRLLLAQETILRRQLQALLLASGQRRLRIAVPFVLDPAEVLEVRRIAEEERALLVGQGLLAESGLEFGSSGSVEVGAVLEVPGALFHLPALAAVADFFAVHLDSLAGQLLAADRQVAELEPMLRTPHPALLAALVHTVEVAVAHRAPLSVFGTSLDDPEVAWLIAGTGLRTFAVAPRALVDLARSFAEADLGEAEAAVAAQTGAGARSRRRGTGNGRARRARG